MNRTKRLYNIDILLNQRRCVPIQSFLAELEVSLPTFKRDLDYLHGGYVTSKKFSTIHRQPCLVDYLIFDGRGLVNTLCWVKNVGEDNRKYVDL